MANVIKLHKGLNINLKGKAAQEIFTVNAPDTYAIVPDDFHGVTPKVVVKEQERQWTSASRAKPLSRPWHTSKPSPSATPTPSTKTTYIWM